MPYNVKPGPYGYLDLYDTLRAWQKELCDLRNNLKPTMEETSKSALETLDGVFYLVEGQLIRDADGAN